MTGLYAPDGRVIHRDQERNGHTTMQDGMDDMVPPCFPPSRTLDHYRRNRAILFHVPVEQLPVAVAQLPPLTDIPTNCQDPIRNRRVTVRMVRVCVTGTHTPSVPNVREAQSLMITHSPQPPHPSHTCMHEWCKRVTERRIRLHGITVANRDCSVPYSCPRSGCFHMMHPGTNGLHWVGWGTNRNKQNHDHCL